jgi:oligopeptidase B
MDRSSKVIVHSYGCYGECMEPTFDLAMLAALELGFVVVYAHIRGGREKGLAWHQQAVANKLVSAWDLEDVVQHLVGRGYANPARIGLWSGSAGAVATMGLVNRRPSLVKCIYLHMPFLNVL